MAGKDKSIKVALFCGGRGSATLIRNLVQVPAVDLSLLINAYDDGLSTGELRDFIPGMLGPSDFRKNLSTIIDLYSSGQYALQKLLEFRLPQDITAEQVAVLHRFARGQSDAQTLLPSLRQLFDPIGPETAARIKTYLKTFFAYAESQTATLKYADCSLGNLVFAGAYLMSGRDFNRTNQDLVRLFDTQAELVNVCGGAAHTLVALKENGDVLGREAEIVGEQNASPIIDFFFIDKALSPEEVATLDGLSNAEKAARLRAREDLPHGSPEAIATIENADIIIFGPGTQHSSLLPSYRIEGIGEALRRSQARVKAFVVNVGTDHDIQAFDAQTLIDTALKCMGDADNAGGTITHILYNSNSQTRPDGIRLPEALAQQESYKNAALLQDHFENPIKPHAHSGSRVVARVLELFYRKGKSPENETLDIYVDLVSRGLALDSLVQKFSEIEWRNHFSKVNLLINGPSLGEIKLPPNLAISYVGHGGAFPEVEVLVDWLGSGGDYLATLTGDGEYRLRDILTAFDVLSSTGFGAIYGSRTQSRHRFRSSQRAVYGERTLLYFISFLGAFFLSSVFALLYGRIFADPMTGFRLYSRHRLPPGLKAALRHARSAAAVTRIMLRQGVEIGEAPVRYRTFRDFSRPSWRLGRGIRNLLGLLG